MEYVKYDPKQRETLRTNLKRLMDEKGVTKTQLSKKLGWSYNTIDYWIRGDRVPDKTGIEAICDYFGISDVELLGSEMKVRTFAYYKNDTLIAFGDHGRNRRTNWAKDRVLAESALQLETF